MAKFRFLQTIDVVHEVSVELVVAIVIVVSVYHPNLENGRVKVKGLEKIDCSAEDIDEFSINGGRPFSIRKVAEPVSDAAVNVVQCGVSCLLQELWIRLL